MRGVTVRWKDICLDALDTARVARFWGEALALDVVPHPSRPGVVALERDGRTVLWVNPTDRPALGKNRVHLDLHVPDVDALVALGATVLDEHHGWVVLADPEGNEACAFPSDGALDPPARVFALCVDSDRPEELARWWADRTGASVGPGPDGTPRWLTGVPGLGDVIWKFVRVADERVEANRLHWDVEADVDALVAAGATVVRRPDDDISWTVLDDPQGNAFCAFAP